MCSCEMSTTVGPRTSLEMHLGAKYLVRGRYELNLGTLKVHILTSRAWNRG